MPACAGSFCPQAKIGTYEQPGLHNKSLQLHQKVTSDVSVLKKFLHEGETVLIVDDFLANGEAALGLADIAHQAGCKVAGIGIVIEKSFQPGHQRIVDAGYHLESLARIKAFKDGKVVFEED